MARKQSQGEYRLNGKAGGSGAYRGGMENPMNPGLTKWKLAWRRAGIHATCDALGVRKYYTAMAKNMDMKCMAQ